jgi:polar amino acid transport system permease protein
VEEDHRAGRGSLILGGAGRNVSIAVLSTLVFFTAVILIIVNAPGWENVKHAFFDPTEFRHYFKTIAHAFVLNIKVFLVAEVLILIFALGLAVLRGLSGPVFFPLRLIGIIYTDVFRGIPTILLVYLFGFGIPALHLSHVTGRGSSPSTRARRRRLGHWD